MKRTSYKYPGALLRGSSIKSILGYNSCVMDFFLNILTIVQSLGHWGYAVAFLFAFTESLALVGGFVPGSTAIVILGFMSANGYLNPLWLCLPVVIGAILGDSVRYWLGSKGTHLFRDENKILKASHLELGKTFFHKHGDKSIFLGRFVGVIRAMIPFTAGLAKMKQSKFLFWNIISGVAWGVSHIYLGYFFGGALKAIEIVSKRLALFILIVLFFAFIIWILIKILKPTFRVCGLHFKGLLCRFLQSATGKRFVVGFPKTYILISKRFETDTFYGWTLTVLTTMLSLFVLLFAVLADGVLDNQTLVSLDQRVAGFFYYFRDPTLIKISFWITFLGNYKTVIVFSTLFIVILLLWHKKHLIMPLIISVAGSAGLADLIKMIINRPRPTGVIPVYYETLSSFPSGHSVIAVALYGFIFYVISRSLYKKKKAFQFVGFLFVTIIIVFFIGLSRLYLGVHYFSDVIGGYLIGMIALLVAVALAKWSDLREKTLSKGKLCNIGKTKKIILTATIVVLAVAFYSIFGSYYRPALISNHIPEIINSENGQSPEDIFVNHNWSYSVESVFGLVQVPINIVFWADNEKEINDLFKEDNWSISNDPSVRLLFKLTQSIAFGQGYDTIPALPYFWSQIPNDFAYEKNNFLVNGQRHREQVRVWKTSIFNQNQQRMYVAVSVSSSRGRFNPIYSIDTLTSNVDVCQSLRTISEEKKSAINSLNVPIPTRKICEISIHK